MLRGGYDRLTTLEWRSILVQQVQHISCCMHAARTKHMPGKGLMAEAAVIGQRPSCPDALRPSQKGANGGSIAHAGEWVS